MDLARPISSVIPGLTGRVLGVLGRTDAPLTGRAIAQALRPAGSQAGVAKVLNELVAHGIVLRSDAGPAAQYVLNRNHLASPMIESLAELRVTFLERLTQEVEAMRPRPLSAYLYGSAARGDGSVDSDIDIALVVPDELDGLTEWDEATAGLRQRVEAMTGNAVSLVEFRPSELFGTADHWLPPVLRAEGIRLGGTTVDDLERRWATRDARAAKRAARLVAAGRYADAVPDLERVVESYRGFGDRLSEGQSLGELGDALYSAERWDESAEAFERAAAALDECGAGQRAARAFARAGSAYAMSARHDRAEQAYLRALAADPDDAAWRGWVLGELSHSQLALGEADRARASAEEAIRLLGEARSVLDQARVLLRYADLVVMTEPAAAVDAATRALEAFTAAKDRRSAACALLRLGMALAITHRVDDGRVAFREALRLSRQVDDQDLEGDALMMLGLTYVRTGDDEESVRHLAAAADAYRKVGDVTEEARALDALALAHDRAGRHSEAIGAYKTALDAFRRVGDTPGARRALHNLDRIHAVLLRPEAS